MLSEVAEEAGQEAREALNRCFGIGVGKASRDKLANLFDAVGQALQGMLPSAIVFWVKQKQTKAI